MAVHAVFEYQRWSAALGILCPFCGLCFEGFYAPGMVRIVGQIRDFGTPEIHPSRLPEEVERSKASVNKLECLIVEEVHGRLRARVGVETKAG